MSVIRFLCLGIALSFAHHCVAVSVDGVRLWKAPDHTRLVFDLSGPVKHRLFQLSNPKRLVVDIDGATFSASMAALKLDGSPVSRIRHGKRNGSDLRVVLDMEVEAKPRSFVLAKHGNMLDRLVIDLYDVEKETIKTVEKITEKIAEKRDVIIAIDAGHGGEDPGAIGPKRLKEKDVVFKITRELERLVNSEPGYKAKLIRTGDYYIPLQKRRNKARQMRADLFISVHADAFKNKNAKGASVFALSSRGATSETARFLASKENEADLIGGVGGVSLDDKDDVVAGVLVDLSMTASLASSLDVGARVLKQIGGITTLHKKQVEQAGFAVLKSPDVPSILVETGFISNPQEAKKLSTSRHRKKLAKAIFSGVKSYFNDTPPAGSYLAWKKSGGDTIQYTIARGDTLIAIARRYKVSVADLKKANRLQNTRIKVGQKLTIPTS